jgi:Leucine-rich repeat (LRR) protein
VLAERAPKLTSLRVSGCRDALHAGLGTFGARLQVLELADVELDDVLLDRIRQLSGLRALVLSRVRIGSVTPEALATLGRNAAIEHLVLRELETDSLIADLLGDISTLKIVQLEGAWAGHRAMTSLSRAKRLEALGLVDTNVGNFSLNQVEGLSRLREVEWVGATFNDYSPLHLRDLPIERFRCACSRFGDAGVRHLAYLPRLADLELSQGRFQARALEKLSDLAALERLVLMDVPLDEPDLAGLARLPRLRVLVIGNASLVATAAPHLGELTTLRELHLDLDGFGDLAAPELSTLTALEVLDLGAAPLSDDAIAALAPLASLRVLLLHGSRVTNRGLQTIGGLAKLERLDLDHTDVVDAGIARISGLSSLRSLRLDHTLITDAALPSLAELESLQELDLSHTVVTDAGVATLAKLPALARLSLAGTRTSAATRRAHSGSSAAERSADAAPATGGAATDAAHGAVDQTLAAPIPTADTSRLPGDPRPPEAASPPEGARSPGDSTKSTSPGEASRANE